MIVVRCLHALSEAAPYREAMTALNLAAARPDPFSSPDYLERHLEGLAARVPPPQLWLLLAFRDETLIGYAALKRQRTWVLGLLAAKLDWLTDHAAPCPHVVTREEDSEAVCAALCDHLMQRADEWSLLEFQQQPPRGALATALARELARHHRLRSWPNLTHWAVPLAGRSLATYYAALSPRFRSNLSRQMRRLFAAGAVSVMESNDAAALPQLMAHYRQIVPTSWKYRSRDIDPGPPMAPTDLPISASAMPITVQLLLLDGVVVAGLVCGDHADATYALEMAYDARQAALAPGLAMLFFGLHRAIRIGTRRFEMLDGFGYYKHRWLGVPTDTQSLQVYRRGSPWDLHRLLGDALRRPRHASAPLDHNPSRRGAALAGDRPLTAPPADVTQQRVSREGLEALGRQSGVHGQTAAALAAVLPFSLGPQKARPPPRTRVGAAAAASSGQRSAD